MRQRLDQLAESYGRSGQFDRLASELDSIDPTGLSMSDAEAWFQLRGIADWRRGKPDSIQWFREGASKIPQSGLLAFSLGQALEQHGQWAQAAETFQRVTLGAGPEQQKLGLDPVPAAYVLTIARYCYLWGAFDEGQRHVEQLLGVYGELRIADDTFVYLRGLPFVNEVLETNCALALLAGTPEAASKVLDWAEQSLTDLTVEQDRLCLQAWVTGDWRPVLDSLRSRNTREPATVAFSGFDAMRLASISSRTADSLEAGLAALEGVDLAPTDFPWLGDIRTLAAVGLADRFGDRQLRERAVRDFLTHQALLFEPHHVFNFGLLEIQDPLRSDYQSARRALSA
jgi:hypothetical protein